MYRITKIVTAERILLSFAVAVLLVLSLGSSAREVAEANFYMPPAETVWTIQEPKNYNYGSNDLALNFTVETNLGLLYFYSIDGQEKQEIVTNTISKVPLPQYPPFIDGSLWDRRTEQGTTQLPYLSKGTHTLTIYQIYPRSPEKPEEGNVVSQTSVTFNITSNLPKDTLAPSTIPSPSPSPQLPSPSITPKALNSIFSSGETFFTIIISVTALVDATSLVLVYINKHRH
jgi:hypothetical protein